MVEVQGEQGMRNYGGEIYTDLLLGVEAAIHVLWVSPSPGAKLCQLGVRLDLYAPPLQCLCTPSTSMTMHNLFHA